MTEVKGKGHKDPGILMACWMFFMALLLSYWGLAQWYCMYHAYFAHKTGNVSDTYYYLAWSVIMWIAEYVDGGQARRLIITYVDKDYIP